MMKIWTNTSIYALLKRIHSYPLDHFDLGLILPTPTAEWSASLEQPCKKVLVTPLLLLSSEDDLMMNCLYLYVCQC